jgi:subtilisin family serine protease
MDLTDAPLGYAFEGDYPESYGDFTQRLQQVLRRQLDELDRRSSPARAAEILGILRGRRCGRQDLPQLEVRLRRDGSECLVARGEIVMAATEYADPKIQGMLASRGFDGYTERRGGIVRLRRPAVYQPDVESTLDEAGSLGAVGWPNYIATMAAVGKGIGGPEPVQSLGDFSDYGLKSAGTPARVAVIDTGIPADKRSSDGWLDRIDRTSDNRDLLDLLPCGPDGYLDFQAGHGTFVAGIIERVAPGADIRVYRAADTDGFATDDDVADAMLRAVDDNAQIINLSLGGRTADDQPPLAMARAVSSIFASRSRDEVVIVAAAGNYGDTSPCWPAALPQVDAVAGLTAHLSPAQWSSHGNVRFSTVAEGIRSTFVTGRESPIFDRDPETFPPNAWAMWSGTSFAAPQVAGAIARICQELGLTPRQAMDKLDERGKPVAGFGKAMRILEGVR